MKKIAIIAVLISVMAMPALFAQNNIYLANPQGNAVSSYKNALYNDFNEVFGGFTNFQLTNSVAADSLMQILTIDRNSRKVSDQYLTAVTNLSGVDYIIYTIIDERNGRLNVEAIRINCSNGLLDRMLSQSIPRSLQEIRIITQVFAKQLMY
ncbi:MAG: hypothetical protein IJQ89_05720 [Bacteroidales bacterium]|nr:hypothetical protein [Bacteroidales bacterium]MBQ6726061.1 hypothetical protein [Bacteroidales bacterium]